MLMSVSIATGIRRTARELYRRDRLLTSVAMLLLAGAALMALGAPLDLRTVAESEERDLEMAILSLA